MSDKSMGSEDPIRSDHLEPEDETLQRLTIELPDELSDEQSEFLKEIQALEIDEREDAFSDLSELFAVEELEELGIAEEWPLFPGSRIHIAHFNACMDKKTRLEIKYREKKKEPFGTAINPLVEERLWQEAMYGTVVKGWDALPMGGNPFPFNRKNYTKLIGSRRFRRFVWDIARSNQKYRDAMEETARGN